MREKMSTTHYKQYISKSELNSSTCTPPSFSARAP